MLRLPLSVFLLVLLLLRSLCFFLLCLFDVSACLRLSCSSCLSYLSHWFGAGFDSPVKLTSWCSPV